MSRKGYILAAIVSIPLLFFAIVSFGAESVSANSASGPGGTGECTGGGCSGAHTKNGFGWYEFSSSSSASVNPRGMKNNGNWSSVKAQCRGLGADKVMAFLILANPDYRGSSGAVYDYTSWYANTNNGKGTYPHIGYIGNRGTPWITNNTAKSRYQSAGLPMSKWESSVGWFCYNSNPSWSITPTSYVTKTSGDGSYGGRSAAGRTVTASPGETVWFKHIIDKTGSGTASYQRWREQSTNGGSFTNRNSNYPITSSLSGSSVTYPVDGSNGGPRSYKVPSGAKHGDTYCQRYRVSPRSNSSSAVRTSSPACVQVVRQWSISPTVSVNRTTAAPGQSITWTHNIRNNGPHSTSAAISYEARNAGTLGTGRAGGAWTRGSGLGASGTATDRTTSVTVTQGHVGESLCRTTRANPRSHSNTGSITSGQACVSVPFNYSLTPRAPDVPDSGEAGSTIPSVAGGRVTNNGLTKSRDDTIWQLTSFVRRSGQAVESAENNNTAPCGTDSPYGGMFYRDGCKSLDRGNGSVSTGTPRNLNASNITIPDNLEVGDRFCFAVSVRDRTHNPGNTPWRHSAPTCIIISKKPKVNVLGGDLWVRANRVSDSSVSTSITSNSEGVFGSFVEYALAARGDVSGMASAAGYHGSSSVRLLCGVSFLTLGNNGANNSGCSDHQVGRYGRLPSTSPRLENRFSTNSSNRLASGASLSGRSGTHTAEGSTLTINQSTIDKGDSVILVAPSTDVIISGNIEYDDGEMSSVSDIPQVIIIARNIYINQGVENVDAWLVANGDNLEHGYINTCRVGGTTQQSKDMARGLNSETCDRPLTVNGPVMANHLLMRRTAGAGAMNRSGEPAEVFNLRPDAYLWMANRINSGVGMPTTSTRELPPKY